MGVAMELVMEQMRQWLVHQILEEEAAARIMNRLQMVLLVARVLLSSPIAGNRLSII
jgi:hypothetical protein